MTNSTLTIDIQNSCLSFELARTIGAEEAFFFQALIAKFRYYSTTNTLSDNDEFFSTIEDMKESTGLGRKKQEKIIDKLSSLGLITCSVKGIPARRFFKINFTNNIVTVVRSSSSSSHSFAKRDVPKEQTGTLSVCPKRTTKVNNNNLLNNISSNKEELLSNHIVSCCTKIKSTTKHKKGIRQAKIELIEKLYGTQEQFEKFDKLGVTVLKAPQKNSFQESCIELMSEVYSSKKEFYFIGGEEIYLEDLKERLNRIELCDIDEIEIRINSLNSPIKNIRAYLLKCLYDAPVSNFVYYSNQTKVKFAV